MAFSLLSLLSSLWLVGIHSLMQGWGHSFFLHHPTSLCLFWAEGQGRMLSSNMTSPAVQGRMGVHPVPQPDAA